MSFSSSELLVPTTSVSPALCPSVVWSDASAAATAGGRITDQTCRWRCYHRAVACPRRAWHAGHGRLPRRLARDRAAHSIIIWSNKSKPYYLVVLPKFIIIVQLEIIAGAVGERDCKADDQMMSTASSHWHCSSQPSVGPTCTSPGGQPEGSI